jgi:hypothetical protein
MTHYGLDSDLRISYLLKDLKTGEILDMRLMSPSEAEETNRQAVEYNDDNPNADNIRWIKDPAGP